MPKLAVPLLPTLELLNADVIVDVVESNEPLNEIISPVLNKIVVLLDPIPKLISVDGTPKALEKVEFPKPTVSG